VAQALLIDDDENFSLLLQNYLKDFGIFLDLAAEASAGIEALRTKTFDLLLLDYVLPESNGVEICKDVRSFSDIPIIFLTIKEELQDKLNGLENGADDYLTKPFEPRELVARINSVLRRYTSGPGVVEDGDSQKEEELLLDYQNREAFLRGESLALTTLEYDILCFFSKNPNVVKSRDEIMKGLRGIEWPVTYRGIDTAISRLRKKLGDCSKNPKFFKTIWGTGYMFIKK
jgi:DNA-binding response OmpR family regulator